MMIVKAEIKDGIVANLIVVDPLNVPDWCADWPDADANADMGGTYADGVFTLPPPPPPPVLPIAEERARMKLTFAQLLTGLVAEQWISDAEGRAWLKGTLPQALLNLIATLPASQQFGAVARATAPSEVLRLDPLVELLGAAQDKSAQEVDTFFQSYANL